MFSQKHRVPKEWILLALRHNVYMYCWENYWQHGTVWWYRRDRATELGFWSRGRIYIYISVSRLLASVHRLIHPSIDQSINQSIHSRIAPLQVPVVFQHLSRPYQSASIGRITVPNMAESFSLSFSLLSFSYWLSSSWRVISLRHPYGRPLPETSRALYARPQRDPKRI